ncbi:hypothetical protein [Methanogenium sp. MK-MG]|uniref:hypothetical protein n=1 Tax=Methanogenium sp. MK-MG TaxID=2599926 RepID=UPI0013EB6DCC|nr:hypothetical protein [Methanogenium sp. MK-MG]
MADSASHIASGIIPAEEGEQSNILARYDGGHLSPCYYTLLYMPPTMVHPVYVTRNVRPDIIPLPGMLTPKEFSRTAKGIGV